MSKYQLTPEEKKEVHRLTGMGIWAKNLSDPDKERCAARSREQSRQQSEGVEFFKQLMLGMLIFCIVGSVLAVANGGTKPTLNNSSADVSDQPLP